MIFNTDTLASVAILIVFIGVILAAIRLSQRLIVHILELVVIVFMGLFLFIWTPTQMTNTLHLDSFLKPTHVAQAQTYYQKVVDIRENIFNYFNNHEKEGGSYEEKTD